MDSNDRRQPAIFLTPEEQARFASWCLFQAENEKLLLEQLAKLPITIHELVRIKKERIVAYMIVAKELKLAGEQAEIGIGDV